MTAKKRRCAEPWCYTEITPPGDTTPYASAEELVYLTTCCGIKICRVDYVQHACRGHICPEKSWGMKATAAQNQRQQENRKRAIEAGQMKRNDPMSVSYIDHCRDCRISADRCICHRRKGTD